MVMRLRGSYILYVIGSQMAVSLSASRAGLPLPPVRLLVLMSVREISQPQGSAAGIISSIEKVQ
jgi:hypothetical protein